MILCDGYFHLRLPPLVLLNKPLHASTHTYMHSTSWLFPMMNCWVIFSPFFWQKHLALIKDQVTLAP